MYMILHFVLFITALYGSDYLLPFITIKEGLVGLIVTAVLLYLSNHVVIPILRLLTFPINILTFGFSSTVIATLVTYFTLKLNPYLEYMGFLSLVIFIMLLNCIWWILSKVV